MEAFMRNFEKKVERHFFDVFSDNKKSQLKINNTK